MSRLKILGYDYKVILAPSVDAGGFHDAGNCSSLNQVIALAPGLNDQALASTLIHEVLEALNYHLSLELDHGTIMALETGLFQVLNDNGVDISVMLPKRKKEKK
jgi:hypothetical protein